MPLPKLAPPTQVNQSDELVAYWLMTQALSEVTLQDLLDGCCARLAAAGVPLERSHIAFRTLHPLFHAIGLTWQRGTVDRAMLDAAASECVAKAVAVGVALGGAGDPNWSYLRTEIAGMLNTTTETIKYRMNDLSLYDKHRTA